jgi:glycosyltransferase involved in cell wall biosynthesis
MQQKFFSIIVVSLNPGEGLKKTLDSILCQSFTDYEVIIKDGGSRDQSLETLEKQGYFSAHPALRVVKQPDKSIYDGMNQALTYRSGRFVQFLNCGDLFYDEDVLKQVAGQVQSVEKKEGKQVRIYYGNQYNRKQNCVVYSAPRINDLTCYRNVPCHQVCFYDSSLFDQRGYLPQYTVRADYEHFLYCIYDRKAQGISLPILVASYEGGGFSETKENRKRSAEEHRQITLRYLGRKKVRKYRLLMLLTLAPLRTGIAQNPTLAAIYNGCKNGIYRILGKENP